MGYYSYSTMGGFETGRDSEPEKDKNLTEAVSYIYEDVKDTFSEDIKETKKNQGLMSSNFSDNNDNDDNDDSPPTILENVTDVAKAFMGFFGQAGANPLLGVATGITASISGSSVADQLEKVRKIDTPFDYNKVYNQYLETPKTGLVTIPSRAKTAAAFKGSLSDESMFVPTTLGSFTPPPSTATGYGAGTDETMFVPTSTGNPVQALLDQISIGEGASYGSVYGDNLYVQPSKAITDMKLSELFEYQKLLIKDTKGKIPGQLGKAVGTSAVGRYQVTKTNLFGKNGTPENPERYSTAFKLGLTKDTVYNKATQEKIGEFILNDAGYKDFITGKIDKKEFQSKLSGKFASIEGSTAGQPVGTTTKEISPILDYLKNSPIPPVPARSDFPLGTIPEVRPYSKEEIFKSPYPVKRPTIDTTTQTAEATTDNDDALPDEGEFFDLRSVPIDTLLDPSIYLFGTNDREEKIKILKQMGIIQSV